METERTMEGKQMKWLEYYKGKTVLVTGHTGFKGSWLCVMLEMAGAKVVGYALPSLQVFPVTFLYQTQK